MAHIPRCARIPDDWSELELEAYNIDIRYAGTPEFFDIAELPAPSVSETILSNVREPSGALPREERHFFRYLQLANVPAEPAVIEFATMLLRLCDYDQSGEWYTRQNKNLQLVMEGRYVDTKAALVLLTGGHECKLVVRVVERVGSFAPDAQIVADSIALFQENCRRQTTLGRAPMENQVIPGIAVVGSAVYFYRTNVTQSLLDSLDSSTYPSETTVVLKYRMAVLANPKYRTEGMRALDNRRAIFQALQALRAIL